MSFNLRQLLQDSLAETFGGNLAAAVRDFDFIEGLERYFKAAPDDTTGPFYGHVIEMQVAHDELTIRIKRDRRPFRDVLLEHYRADGQTPVQILKTRQGRIDLASLGPNEQPFPGWRVRCNGTSVVVVAV